MATESEKKIERELQEKGKTAERITPDHLDTLIVKEDYHHFPGTTVIVAALTLENGFVVVGQAASAHPENFDEEIGRKIARSDARDKIWALEGYRLREKLYQEGK
jgi:hypothetical protein